MELIINMKGWNMEKILLINNGYPSKTNPQYSTYIKSIYDCMIKANLDVEILVLNTNFKTKKEKIVKYIKYYKKLFFHDYSKYDAIYIHNYPHSFLPLVFKLSKIKKLTIHWHGTDIFAPTQISEKLNNLSYKFIPKGCKHMTPSDYFADMVSKKLNIKRDEIFVSPSGGINTNIFKSTKVMNVDKQTITLGFASSMRTDKGMDFVLRLMQESDKIKKTTNKGIKLVCINYGLEKEFYSKELLKLSNVEIIEPLAKSKMVDFYQSIDLLLLLSTRMAESLALVGLEAMSCDVPVIGTNDFAIKDYVLNGKSGERFEKANYKSFFDAIVKSIQNLDKYKPREIVMQEYSQECVIEQYKNYFGEHNE
jgi:glycosyltransferase involved in cell wall biosynthesis